jgi:hypothetical protein
METRPAPLVAGVEDIVKTVSLTYVLSWDNKRMRTVTADAR